MGRARAGCEHLHGHGQDYGHGYDHLQDHDHRLPWQDGEGKDGQHHVSATW